MSNQIRWAQSDYDAYLRKFKGDNRAPVPVADTKSPRRDGTAATDETKNVHPRYRVVIRYRSKKLADPTGRSHKAAVDGLVRSGILGDDSSEFIESITTSETKCGRGEKEQTQIDLYEVSDGTEGSS